jgi:hypothetical protein
MKARHAAPKADLEIARAWAFDLKTISQNVRSLHLGSLVFWDIQKIIGENPKTQTHGLFNRWMATNYAVATAIGIRRQLDMDSRSVSLMGLLSTIGKTVCGRPNILSRENFIENYPLKLRQAAEAEFDRLVRTNAERVEVSAVCRDMSRLDTATRNVKSFANKRAAHWDRQNVGKAQLGDLDVALKMLIELVKKYGKLITGYAPSVEAKLTREWKSVLTVPWIAQPTRRP